MSLPNDDVVSRNNPIGSGRFSRFLRKLFAVRSADVDYINLEVQPTVDVLNPVSAESYYGRDENLFNSGQLITGAAGVFSLSVLEVVSPNAIVVVDSLCASVSTGSSSVVTVGVGTIASFGAIPASTSIDGTHYADSRNQSNRNRRPGIRVSGFTSAAVLGSHGFVARLNLNGDLPFRIPVREVLTQGFYMFAFVETANVSLTVQWQGYERIATSDEVGAN